MWILSREESKLKKFLLLLAQLLKIYIKKNQLWTLRSILEISPWAYLANEIFSSEISLCAIILFFHIKFYKTKFDFISIGDNFKIAAYLFFKRFVKNAIKKTCIFNFCLIKFLQINSDKKFIFNVIFRDEKNYFRG